MTETKLEYEGSRNEPGVCGTDIASRISKPFLKILRQRKSTTRLFFELINKLDKFFCISRAVLIVINLNGNVLRVVAAWDNNSYPREGVILTLPQKDSLFHRALDHGAMINEPIFSRFPGNYVERKLLASKSTCSLLVCPLCSNDLIFGLVGLTSLVPYAFELIAEGCYEQVFQRLGKLLCQDGMIL